MLVPSGSVIFFFQAEDGIRDNDWSSDVCSSDLTCTKPGTCTNGRCDDGITACTSSSQCPAVVFTTTGTVMYQEPIPQGSGSCGNSTTAGESLATWGDGRHTVVSYNTTGALAAVQVQGP